MTWVKDLNTPNNIFVLPETPASDNLLIESAVVRDLSFNKQLTSFFFFDFEPSQKTAAVCVRRIAYDLTKRSESIQGAIVRLLKDSPHFLETTPISRMYEELVHKNLESTLRHDIETAGSPFVIILGAVDECTAPNDRTALESILKRWTQLPSHCKLIVSGCDVDNPGRIRPPKPHQTQQRTKSNSSQQQKGPCIEGKRTHVFHHINIIDQRGTSVPLNPTSDNNTHAPEKTTPRPSRSKTTPSSATTIIVMDRTTEIATSSMSSVITPTTVPVVDQNISQEPSFNVPSPTVDPNDSVDNPQTDDGTIHQNVLTSTLSAPMLGTPHIQRLTMSKNLLSTLASPAIFSSSSLSSSHALVMSILGQSTPFATRMIFAGAGKQNIPSIRDAIIYLGGDTFMKIRSRFAWSTEDLPDTDFNEADEEGENQFDENRRVLDEAAQSSSPTEISADPPKHEEEILHLSGGFCHPASPSSISAPISETLYKGTKFGGHFHRIMGDTLADSTNKASSMYSDLVRRSSLTRNAANESEKNGEADTKDSRFQIGDTVNRDQRVEEVACLQKEKPSFEDETSNQTSVTESISTSETSSTPQSTRKNLWLSQAQMTKG
jgi:hypothetical protein